MRFSYPMLRLLVSSAKFLLNNSADTLVIKERVLFFFPVALTQPRIFEFFLTSRKTHRIRETLTCLYYYFTLSLYSDITRHVLSTVFFYRSQLVFSFLSIQYKLNHRRGTFLTCFETKERRVICNKSWTRRGFFSAVVKTRLHHRPTQHTFYFLMKILCRPYSPYCTFSFFSPRSQLLFFFFFLQMNSFFFSFPPSFFIFPSLPAATPARTWLVLLRSTSLHAHTHESPTHNNNVHSLSLSLFFLASIIHQHAQRIHVLWVRLCR